MHDAFASVRPRSISTAFIGMIVGYIKRKQQAERELLSLRRWHIVRTWTGSEAKVARKIEQEINLGTYIPLEPVLRNSTSTRRQWHPQVRPIYPGYIFAGFDPRGVLWPRIEEIDRVIGIIKVDGHLVQMGDAEMARIREIEGLRLDHRTVVQMPVHVGASVRVLDYMPYTGLFAPVVEVDHEGRKVLANLTIMGADAPLWLNEGRFEVV